MTRDEIVARCRAVVNAGYSTEEKFRAETGHELLAMPKEVPEIIVKWMYSRWSIVGRRSELLQELSKL